MIWFKNLFLRFIFAPPRGFASQNFILKTWDIEKRQFDELVESGRIEERRCYVGGAWIRCFRYRLIQSKFELRGKESDVNVAEIVTAAAAVVAAGAAVANLHKRDSPTKSAEGHEHYSQDFDRAPEGENHSLFVPSILLHQYIVSKRRCSARFFEPSFLVEREEESRLLTSACNQVAELYDESADIDSLDIASHPKLIAARNRIRGVRLAIHSTRLQEDHRVAYYLNKPGFVYALFFWLSLNMGLTASNRIQRQNRVVHDHVLPGQYDSRQQAKNPVKVQAYFSISERQRLLADPRLSIYLISQRAGLPRREVEFFFKSGHLPDRSDVEAIARAISSIAPDRNPIITKVLKD